MLDPLMSCFPILTLYVRYLHQENVVPKGISFRDFKFNSVPPSINRYNNFEFLQLCIMHDHDDSVCNMQYCNSGSGSRVPGTFPPAGSGSLKNKTSTKIIRKSYLNFLRNDFFFS